MTTPTVSPRLAPWFADYARYHRTRGNQVTHLIGIPVLMVAILGLLGQVVIFGADFWTRVDLARVLWLGAALWYLWLDWRLAIVFGIVAAGCYLGGLVLPLGVLWALFVVGWVVQYVGHVRYEKKQPAFHKNLAHLLIGPLWVFSKVLGWRMRAS